MKGGTALNLFVQDMPSHLEFVHNRTTVRDKKLKCLVTSVNGFPILSRTRQSCDLGEDFRRFRRQTGQLSTTRQNENYPMRTANLRCIRANAAFCSAGANSAKSPTFRSGKCRDGSRTLSMAR